METRQPTVFFLLLPVSLPPHSLPALSALLREQFAANPTLWKLLRKSFPLQSPVSTVSTISTTPNPLASLVSTINAGVSSLAASWLARFPRDSDLDGEETPAPAPAPPAAPLRIRLSKTAGYSQRALSAVAKQTVERETLTPLACMSVPWSLKRLARSLSANGLAFLFLCVSLGLRITAWSKRCVKFNAACAMIERLARTARVEVGAE